MKLAEALMQRADCQKRIAQLRQRLTRSAKVQEGEQPPENPQELLSEVDTVITELTRLVQRINQTNGHLD
ncbi:DIP1984 family protein [Leptothoe sp. LEGE 181152]|nr:DIP1984 family protein [Leptothoe sp. LEGE 181152]